LFFLLTEQFCITFNLWFLDFKSFEVVCLLQKVRVLVFSLKAFEKRSFLLFEGKERLKMT
jgi:hypothetical protein